MKISGYTLFGKFCPIVILHFLLSITSVAQNKPVRQIGFGSGWTNYEIKSEVASSFILKGNTLPLQLFYRTSSTKSRQHVQLYYASPSLVSSSAAFTIHSKMGYLQYSYLRKIGSIKDRFYFYGGALVDFTVGYRAFTPPYNLGTETDGELLATLSPAIYAEVPMRKDLLSFQSWISILAYEVSSGYGITPDIKRSWQGMDTHSKVDVRLSYSKYFSVRWNGRVDYQFQYLGLQKYDVYKSVNQQVIFSLVYKIHGS